MAEPKRRSDPEIPAASGPLRPIRRPKKTDERMMSECEAVIDIVSAFFNVSGKEIRNPTPFAGPGRAGAPDRHVCGSYRSADSDEGCRLRLRPRPHDGAARLSISSRTGAKTASSTASSIRSSDWCAVLVRPRTDMRAEHGRQANDAAGQFSVEGRGPVRPGGRAGDRMMVDGGDRGVIEVPTTALRAAIVRGLVARDGAGLSVRAEGSAWLARAASRPATGSRPSIRIAT